MTREVASGDPRGNGLQAERTVLAWNRTSFAFLANGVLLMLKDFHGDKGLSGLVLPGLAGAVALCMSVIALQRQRTLGHRPLPTRITARLPVHLVGAAVLVLILVTAIGLPA